MLKAVPIAAVMALAACATTPAPPVNSPMARANPPQAVRIGADGEAIALAFSGGGARAASFSLGALQQLRAMPGADGRPLTDRVVMLTSVSGGSIIAAYYAQHGADGLDTFRAAYLDKDWDRDLHTSALSPRNWLGAWRGGVNERDHLADWLDREVFNGAHMGDLSAGPALSLNAADLFNGVPFAFTPLTFDAVCSDLARVRVADAVAASMAVPIVFAPVLIEPRAAQCPPLPAWVSAAPADRDAPTLVRSAARALQSYRGAMPYVHLVDGGVIDNLGLSAWTLTRLTAENAYAPLAPADAVKLRRFSVFVINAEGLRDADWNTQPAPPRGVETADRAYDVVIEAANRASYDAFRAALAQWREDLIAWRCGLSPAEAAALGAPPGWRCDALDMRADMVTFNDLDEPQRGQIGSAATRVTLPPDLTDALIEGGREAIRRNALAQSLAAAPVQ